MKTPTVRVVVDGSNLATEGRTIPSLAQLDEAVRAFMEEYPHVDVIVVVDASFEHRVAPGERTRFKDAEIAGEIVTPPAGAIGRGDAFILKIAQRIGAIVLSNDSFQEFHEQYPWLFDAGRLIGGKPVRGVGWVFTERNPVRGAKSVRAPRTVKKLAVKLPDGTTPSIGDTLTPVKAGRTTKKAVAKVEAVVLETPVAPVAPKRSRAKKAVAEPALAAPVSVATKTRTPRVPKVSASTTESVSPIEPVATKKTASKRSRPAKDATPAAGAARVADTPSRRSSKKTAPPAGASAATPAPAPAPAAALRRERQPVNPQEAFSAFVRKFKVGSTLTGEVSTFTSHGALIKVAVRGDVVVECYAPTASLGDPAPARARDVLSRGERRSFRLVTVDGERRIAELALS